MALAALCCAALLAAQAEPWDQPRCWMSVYLNPDAPEFYPCAADLAAHGVGGFSCDPRRDGRDRALRWLTFARRYGLKVMDEVVGLGNNPTQGFRPELRGGDPPARAVMIGGVYDGRAVDRHVFAFAAGKHEIVVEPPETASGKPLQPLGPAFRAEVVVPLRPYDGRQHLKILTPTLTPLDGRKARLSFDLTGLDGAMLDKVGLALYWRDDPQVNAWKMRTAAHLSPSAASTRAYARRFVRWCLEPWIKANGGTFPSDTVTLLRFGDECFLHTNPIGSALRANYPVWDYCDGALAEFARVAPDLAYPRTWGFPEIYGSDAYALFLCNYHRACAELVAEAVKEAKRIAPGIRVLRNVTRFGAWSLENDHDGSGQELLSRVLDVIHLDPYGVRRDVYDETVIPDDMAYASGFARRFGKPLLPWLQAHAYGELVPPKPADVRRIFAQHLAFAPDGVMWLGYGLSSPNWGVPGCDADSWREKGGVSSETWQTMGAEHRRFNALPPSVRPKARLAVLRPYSTRAVCCHSDGGFRNPADAMLRFFLRVWTMERHGFYDVFEVPPRESPEERARRERELKDYAWIVSTVPRAGAIVVGAGTEGTVLTERQIIGLMPQFRKTINERMPK